MTLEQYAREVFDYMVNKLPDVNHATLCEITEFFVLKSNNFSIDKVEENNKLWQENMKRYEKQVDKFIERVYK